MRCGSCHLTKLLVSGFTVLLCVMIPATSVGQCDAPVCYLGEPSQHYWVPAGIVPSEYTVEAHNQYIRQMYNQENWYLFYAMLIPQAFAAFMFGHYIVTAFRPVDTWDKDDLACAAHEAAWAGLLFVVAVIMVPLNHASVGCRTPVCYGDGGWGAFLLALTVQFVSAVLFWRACCVVVDERRKVLADGRYAPP